MRSNVPAYFVYLLTNPKKTVLYTGVTNDLAARLIGHWNNRHNRKTFSGRYHSYNLVYYETYMNISSAIAREKEIKGWLRIKKNKLIETTNPDWKFLNEEVCGRWPPIQENRTFVISSIQGPSANFKTCMNYKGRPQDDM
jgi:putative endonuclease